MGRVTDFPEDEDDYPCDTQEDDSLTIGILESKIEDLRGALLIANEALLKVSDHGCCVMHNDYGCPGCIAKDAIRTLLAKFGEIK